MRCLALVSCAATASAVDLRSPAVERANQQIRPAAIRAHMSFLADDLLEGRGTASRGHEISARYIAAQLDAAGLEPGTSGVWLQQVPLRRSELDPAASSVEIIRRNGERTTLAFRRDYLMGGDFRESTDVEAPVVFVGYGITAPELNHDDYAGIDAKGRIVAFLEGGPAAFRIDERAYYSGLKYENAVAHGAVGALLLWTPVEEKSGSWDVVVRSRAKGESFAWLDGGVPHGFRPQLRGSAWLGPAGSRALFDDAGTFADAAAKAAPAEHSTLARAVDAAAEAAGLRIIADPFPERMLFLGSDQYSFVKRGIPSLIVGTLGSGDARALALQWFRTRYHAPSDDLSQPMDFEAAAHLTRNLFLIGYAVAQNEERPRWNPGDFYGELFGSPQQGPGHSGEGFEDSILAE